MFNHLPQCETPTTIDTDLKQMYSLGPKPIILAAVLWFNLLFGGFAVSRFLVGAF